MLVEKPIRQIEKPIKQILIDSREFWDLEGTRPCVRESFRKMIECGTSSLGWLAHMQAFLSLYLPPSPILERHESETS